MSELKLQRELDKIADLLDRMSDDLHEWLTSYEDHANEEGRSTTRKLIVEAVTMRNSLKGANQ